MSLRRLTALSLVAVLAGCNDYSFSSDGLNYADAPENEPPPTFREDISVQRERVSEADVLFVIDNSCSMEDDQARLTSAFPEFMNFFLGLTDIDFHIGVVSTDVERDPTTDGSGLNGGGDKGALRIVDGFRYIDRSVPDPIPYFELLARIGTGGSGNESGTMAAKLALDGSQADWNAGFLRDEALLSVIIVSDEEDSSPGKGLSADQFVGFMDGLKFEPDLLSVSAIVGPAPDGCETADAGMNYLDVQQRLGGISWNICDQQWDQVLEQLAFLASGLRAEFFLTEQPVVETLSVSVLDQGIETPFELDVDYVFDPVRNSIRFNSFVPGPLAHVQINYDVDNGGVHH